MPWCTEDYTSRTVFLTTYYVASLSIEYFCEDSDGKYFDSHMPDIGLKSSPHAALNNHFTTRTAAEKGQIYGRAVDGVRVWGLGVQGFRVQGLGFRGLRV